MEVTIDLLVFIRWFMEPNGTDVGLVGRPVRPDIDTMLSSFLQIEEHPAAEDAKQSGTAQSTKYVGRDSGSGNGIVNYGKYRA